MRTLIVGDTHGDTENLKSVFRMAFERNCEKIIVVGDFGFFPNDADGIVFLKFLDFMVRDSGIQLAFVDGNHDDHYSLREIFEKRASDVIKVSENVEWLWRGKYFDNMLSIGGAYSIDKEHRIKGRDWFENETISYSDFYRCDKEADIILSHDCPLGIEFGFKNDSDTEANRRMLTEICEVVKPKILIHGHYHRFHYTPLQLSFGKVICIGLDCNKNSSAQCLVLNDGKIEYFYGE